MADGNSIRISLGFMRFWGVFARAVARLAPRRERNRRRLLGQRRLQARVRVRGRAVPRARRIRDAERQRIGGVARRACAAPISILTRARASIANASARCSKATGARASVSLARRDSRRFVHVSVRVDDVRQLSRLAPFAWSSYRFDRRGGHVEFRQAVGPPPAAPRARSSVDGRRARRVPHAPAERGRVAQLAVARIERGNILEWEQPLSERLAGRTLNIAVDLEPESILYTTLILFGASIVAAAAALALVIWWIARRGRDSEIAEAA